MARGTLVSELRSVPDDPLAVFELVESQGWGDGLPVIPPTEGRVQAMLEATPLAPAHVVAVVEPRRGEATVEKIAINAVMAGCTPASFPAVLAAVEAVCEPRFVCATENAKRTHGLTGAIGALMAGPAPL